MFLSKTKIFLYLITWMLYAVFHVVSMYFILRISAEFLIVDAVVHAGLFVCLGLLLWRILRYGKYESLIPLQRYINYTALAILIVSLWIGAGYLLNYILLQEIAAQFISTLPIRAMTGILLYLVFTLLFSQANKQVLVQNKVINLDRERNTNTECEIIDRVTIKTGTKLHIIPVQDIIYIQSDGDYAQIITQDGKHLKEQTMRFFETHLPQNLFVRIHRFYIVNIEHISRIESHGKQSQQIVLKNGQWLKTSISGYKSLKEALQL